MDKKKDNYLNSILLNIVLPVIILSKFSKEEYLGPVYGLVVALLFPLGYGLYDLAKQKKTNFISVIGFAGVLFSGLIGLMKFPPHWIAVKEAAVPLIIGIVVLISTKTNWQFVRKIIYNKNLLNIDRIEENLGNSKPALEQLLMRANLLLAATFFVSSALNYILAKIIVKSHPGTIGFNEELGRMTMLSFPVIAVPSMLLLTGIFFYIISRLKKLTSLKSDDLFIPNANGKS